jgi:hypothetical protein
MKTIQASLPDFLASAASDLAAKEGMSLDMIIAAALSAQLASWRVRDSIASRAQRGSREHFRKVLDAVPDRPPMPGDEL